MLFMAYGCEVWAPADAAIVPLRDLQSLRRVCRVKSGIPIEVVFPELSVTPWHDFWWRQVLSFWNAMAQADSESIINKACVGQKPACGQQVHHCLP